MSDVTPILELKQVCKQYGAVAALRPPEVLHDVSLTVASAESIAIVGPSGCGKTTLLNIVGGLDRPSAGHVLLNGRDLSTLHEAELAQVRNRDIGFIFQSHHLLPQLTALENVLVPTLVNPNADRTAVHARATQLLERVDLQDRMNYRPAQLSGGQCQRVAVVRALINAPTLVLADEPTGALDRESAETLGVLLSDLNREQQTALIVVTHNAGFAAKMEKVYELRDGALSLKGSAS